AQRRLRAPRRILGKPRRQLGRPVQRRQPLQPRARWPEMSASLKLLPSWLWWLLALVVVASAQQLRVSGLQDDLKTDRAASTDTFGKLSACRETRGNLLVQVSEQNASLADLRALADQ